MYPIVTHCLCVFIQQSLTDGILVLGCVKECNEYELTISLPNGLSGNVQVTHVCEAYSKMLSEQVATDKPVQVRHCES